MNTHKIIRILSIIGLILSLYLTYVHFAPEKQSNASFCNLNDYFSCSTVNKSSYAKFLHIPVAILGALAFILLFYLSIDRSDNEKNIFAKFDYHKVGLFYFSLASFLFMMYLLIAELFIIKAVCVLCIVVLVIVTIIFILALVSYGKKSIEFIPWFFKNVKFE